MIIICLLPILIVACLYVLRFGIQLNHSFSESEANWGEFGDYFGGVLNPFFGFFTFLTVLYTLSLQLREIKHSNREKKQDQKLRLKELTLIEKQERNQIALKNASELTAVNAYFFSSLNYMYDLNEKETSRLSNWKDEMHSFFESVRTKGINLSQSNEKIQVIFVKNLSVLKLSTFVVNLIGKIYSFSGLMEEEKKHYYQLVKNSLSENLRLGLVIHLLLHDNISKAVKEIIISENFFEYLDYWQTRTHHEYIKDLINQVKNKF